MKNSCMLLAVAVAVAASSSANANLLINGNLDRTEAVEIVPGFFMPKPKNWVNTGSRSISGPYEDEMSSEPWAGPAPTPVTTDGNANPPYPEGCAGPDCGVFFRAFTGNPTNGVATGSLHQDVSGVPGHTYKLTGWAGAEANYMAAQSLFALDFLNGSNAVIGSTAVDLVAAGLFTGNGQPFNYKQFTVTGVAPGGTVKVRARVSMIGAQANPGGGGQAFVVDDFELIDTTSITLISAKSRRTHAAAGTFDIDLPLSGTPAVEPRQNGTTPQLVLTFSGTPVAQDGTFNCSQEVIITNGTCQSVNVVGNSLVINKTFVKNACITAAVSGIISLTGDSNVQVVTHEGNVNGNTAVNILDLQAIKNQLNQPVSQSTFKLDVTVNGAINILDLQATKNNLNQTASCP